jgi:WD40 repeat protein
MTSADQLPADFSLFIATPCAIYAHSNAARTRKLFECTSDGIVSARAAKDNSSLLAVADSQLVILHDPAQRGDRKYALKSYEGEPRLLVFSPDSRTLYFTTTLSTSIQAYCIPTGEVLPPPQIHPSPPSVLSISSDGNILLSASSAPPKIYLQDLSFGGSASVSFQPADARSPAVFAAFQPSEKLNPSYTSFLLGFQDGTLSLYRLILATRRQPYQDVYHNQKHAFLLQPTRIGCIKKLHKPAMGGVTAAEFIPGYKARAVSVGHDGRCRLVAFEARGRVLRT